MYNMVIVLIQSAEVPTLTSLLPQQVQADEIPELYVKVVVPEPLTLPPVDTQAVPTLKTLTAAIAALVPIIIILSSYEPKPSLLIS